MTCIPIKWVFYLLPLGAISLFEEGNIFGGIVAMLLGLAFYYYKFTQRRA